MNEILGDILKVAGTATVTILAAALCYAIIDTIIESWRDND